MNKLLGFLLAVVIGSILSSCTGGDHLSPGEAKKIIAAHFKYPIIVSKRIDVRENGTEVLRFLKNGGYIASSPIRTCCGDYYPTTEKGRPYFGEIIQNLSEAKLSFDCGYSKKVIKSIEEIVIDKQTNSATVKYVEGLEPNEPIFSSVIKKSRGGGPDININETQTITAKLKQFAEGWKVEESTADANASSPSSAAKQTAAYADMPGPGEKVEIGGDHYIIYGFDKKPRMGPVIMKVQVFTKGGKKETSMEVRADAGMPSMRGAHETGDRPFTLSNKGDYLLPINIVMPGDWEIRLTLLQEGKVIFRGGYNFDV